MSSGLGIQTNTKEAEPNMPAKIHNIYSDNLVKDAFRHSFYNGKPTPSPAESKTKPTRNKHDFRSKESLKSKQSRNSNYSYAQLSRNSS